MMLSIKWFAISLIGSYLFISSLAGGNIFKMLVGLGLATYGSLNWVAGPIKNEIKYYFVHEEEG